MPRCTLPAPECTRLAAQLLSVSSRRRRPPVLLIYTWAVRPAAEANWLLVHPPPPGQLLSVEMGGGGSGRENLRFQYKHTNTATRLSAFLPLGIITYFQGIVAFYREGLDKLLCLHIPKQGLDRGVHTYLYKNGCQTQHTWVLKHEDCR